MFVNIFEIFQYRWYDIMCLCQIRLNYSLVLVGIVIMNVIGLEGQLVLNQKVRVLKVIIIYIFFIYYLINIRSLGNEMNFKNQFYL